MPAEVMYSNRRSRFLLATLVLRSLRKYEVFERADNIDAVSAHCAPVELDAEEEDADPRNADAESAAADDGAVAASNRYSSDGLRATTVRQQLRRSPGSAASIDSQRR